jgi:hypothetical protein
MKISLFNCVLIGIALGTFITACSNDNSSRQSQTETQEAATVEPIFKDKATGAIFKQYILLKNALVASDFNASKKYAADLTADAGSVPAIADIAKMIAGAKDISEQRLQLEGLTAEVEKQVKVARLSSGVVYKQYCPMANDGNGGYWLAKEADIRNPYYGDEMLQCGEVKEEIK